MGLTMHKEDANRQGIPIDNRPEELRPSEARSAHSEAPPPSPKPPRGPSTAVILAVLATFALALWLGMGMGDRIASGWGRIWASVAGHQHAEASGKRQFYSCGMHPWVIMPKPGLCPICEMELTPIDPAKFSGDVSINPVVAQNIGVRIRQVTTGPLVRTIRTVGTVDYDETRVRDVNTKIGGWIEKLHVDSLGAPVKKGQTLFELYSPELFAAQEEYLLAWRNRDKVGAAFVPDAAKGASDLLESSRTRLLYFDIDPEQIEQLQKDAKPSKTMAIRSRIDGVVIEKRANEGMKVDAGMQVFRIADLSKVWVMVTIYEYQLPYVQAGQAAAMTLPYIPGQTFEGKVIYVYPYLNEKTREVKVRLEFDNPNGVLKPGMFANIELKNQLADERVMAPRSAIIDTGTRQVAFVSLGEGRFEPRTVQMGIEARDGMVEIRDGLKPGEMVVVSGQFLLDSEAKIRESLSRMIKGDLAADQKPVVATSGQSELQQVPEGVARAIGVTLNSYFAISDRLAADSTDGITDLARKLASGIDAMLKEPIAEDEHFWHRHTEAAAARGRALELIGVSDLPQARQKFADLSIALAKLLKATGIPPAYGKEVQELHCPMFREGQGGSVWLQPAGDVRNPYMGSAMLECFDKRYALPVTGAAASPAAPATRPTTQKADAPGLQHVDQMVRAYLGLQRLLTQDKTEGAADRLAEIRQAAAALKQANPAAAALAAKIEEAAKGQAADLAAIRGRFEAISDALLELARLIPPGDAAAPALYHAYCPMVKKGWLQASEQISNPYAPYMLRCGTIKARLK